MVLDGEITPGFAPVALALDETGAVHLLEVRPGEAPRLNARIRTWKIGSGTPPEVFADGFSIAGKGCRPALMAWRGRIFLADSPKLRLFDGPEVAKSPIEVPSRFLPADNSAGTGFGGLTIGPDGRIYGTFAGGTITADGTETKGGAVFRFEPDGSGFEIVERGLTRPSTPMFDDFGTASLLDIRDDGRTVLSTGPGCRLAPPRVVEAWRRPTRIRNSRPRSAR